MKQEWKPTLSLPKHIEVSNDGQVRQYINSTEYELMKISRYSGYPVVNYRGKSYPIHRLLAEAFIPNPEGYKVVNFKNGVKGDNRIENLEWGTHASNFRKGMLSDSRRKIYCKEQDRVFGSMRSAAYLTGLPQDIIAESINKEFSIAGLTFNIIEPGDPILEDHVICYISFDSMIEVCRKAKSPEKVIKNANSSMITSDIEA